MKKISLHGLPLFLLAMLIATGAPLHASALMWSGPVVDVRADLAASEIHDANAAGDGAADDSAAIQAAIDYVARLGGGTVVVPPGTYRVEAIEVKPAVRFVGAGQDRTIFRAAGTGVMFRPTGGFMANFTAYGTPTEEGSGDNWRIGTGGIGRGGTATAVHIIGVYGARDLHIDNVRVMEARYDCLYTRGTNGLRVTNSHFDRAGRNIVSMVGNDQNFVFSGCYFGSHWGLYHFDIEPEAGRYVRDGVFMDCVFDGRQAGELGGDTWGAMLILTGHRELKTRDLSVIGCQFHNISVRVRGVIPGCEFLYNDPMGGRNRVFVKVRTNPVGELRDATVRGNRFIIGDQPAEEINYGVSFSGASIFEDNFPEQFNGLEPDEPGQETDWGEEDHPVAVGEDEQAAAPGEGAANATVRMPLMGHQFRFSDGSIFPHRADEGADLAFHIDPFMAVGEARIALLSSASWDDQIDVENLRWYSELWGAGANDLLALRTGGRRHLLLQILGLTSNEVSFRYRWMD